MAGKTKCGRGKALVREGDKFAPIDRTLLLTFSAQAYTLAYPDGDKRLVREGEKAARATDRSHIFAYFQCVSFILWLTFLTAADPGKSLHKDVFNPSSESRG